MMSFLFQPIEQFIFNPIHTFSNSKYWKWKTTLLLTIASFIFSTGAFFYLPTAFKNENWESYNFKKENLFKQPPYNDASHAAKKTFRITVPLIAKIFHFNNWTTVAFMWAINFFFLFFILQMFLKLIDDKTIAVLGTIGFTFIYVGHAGFTDINTWFDGIAYFFILTAILSRNNFIILSSIILACFTDERAYLSSCLVFLFHVILNSENEISFSFKKHKLSIAAFLAIAIALILRLTIQLIFDLHTKTGGTTITKVLADTDFWGMAMWTFLEGYWLLIIVLGLFLIYQKQYFKTFILLLIIAIFSLASILVFDKTRSGAYIFPLIFIAVLILKNKLNAIEWRYLFLTIAIICFLFPAYYIISDTAPYTLWYKPIFIRAIDFIKLKYSL
ncbi:MAG: hypothetical protein RI955_997 [Bacteroidota bacterium]